MNFKKNFAFVLTGVALLFIIQNLSIVEIQFLFWSFSLPRAIFLVLVLAMGVLIGWLWHSYLFNKHEER